MELKIGNPNFCEHHGLPGIGICRLAAKKRITPFNNPQTRVILAVSSITIRTKYQAVHCQWHREKKKKDSARVPKKEDQRRGAQSFAQRFVPTHVHPTPDSMNDADMSPSIVISKACFVWAAGLQKEEI